MCSASASVSFLSPREKPRKSSERMTPELPRAPRSSAEAHTSATRETVASSGIRLSSRLAAEADIDILVPVSPSGTGKTLSASTACRWLEMLFAPEINASLSIRPVITIL